MLQTKFVEEINYAAAMFRKAGTRWILRNSEFGTHLANIKGRPVETRNQTHSNLIDLSMTVPPIVIAQQYSSTTYVSLRFHPRKEISTRIASAPFPFSFAFKNCVMSEIAWRNSVRGEVSLFYCKCSCRHRTFQFLTKLVFIRKKKMLVVPRNSLGSFYSFIRYSVRRQVQSLL